MLLILLVLFTQLKTHKMDENNINTKLKTSLRRYMPINL